MIADHPAHILKPIHANRGHSQRPRLRLQHPVSQIVLERQAVRQIGFRVVQLLALGLYAVAAIALWRLQRAAPKLAAP